MEVSKVISVLDIGAAIVNSSFSIYTSEDVDCLILAHAGLAEAVRLIDEAGQRITAQGARGRVVSMDELRHARRLVELNKSLMAELLKEGARVGGLS